MICSVYSSALTLTNHFNQETREMLEEVLESFKETLPLAAGELTSYVLFTHMNLSLVLDQMKVDPDQQKECVAAPKT